MLQSTGFPGRCLGHITATTQFFLRQNESWALLSPLPQHVFISPLPPLSPRPSQNLKTCTGLPTLHRLHVCYCRGRRDQRAVETDQPVVATQGQFQPETHMANMQTALHHWIGSHVFCSSGSTSLADEYVPLYNWPKLVSTALEPNMG